MAAGIAFLLGIGGLLDITTSGGRRTGRGFAVIGSAAPFLLFVALLFLPAFAGLGSIPHYLSCGTNLSGIGKAMLIYANDYEDELPFAGGRGATWGPRLKDWTAASRSDAFGLDANDVGGQTTVSSSLYLLVRYGDVMPKAFVCRGDRGTRRFDPNEHLADDKELATFWDFGPDPAMHCSYSYHMPYGPYKLTTSSEPGTPVAADRNPWIDGPRWKAGNFSKFQWDGSVRQQRAGNAMAHWRDGQNVLFLDSHVEFAKRAFCGVDDDNIYTIWNGNDKARGTPPKLGSQPAGRLDSLLVNDPVVP
jgi:prepilin-type processing-associated H-X9-DG protein